MQDPAQARDQLVSALALDLVGPEPGDTARLPQELTSRMSTSDIAETKRRLALRFREKDHGRRRRVARPPGAVARGARHRADAPQGARQVAQAAAHLR